MSLSKKMGLAFRLAASGIYEAVQRSWALAHAYKILETQKSSIPVISVGAIAIGGSGKTPVTMFIADKLKVSGFRPVICSRGYKGSYKGSFKLVSDGHADTPLVTADVCGDEPYLMASRLKTIPVVVARKRMDAVRAAVELLDSNVAILDDGFQHLGLHRDLNIVLLRALMDRMFPVGGLREPFQALNRADVILLDGSNDGLPHEVSRLIGQKPLFRMFHEPDCVVHGLDGAEYDSEVFSHRNVFLLSGIANPKRFEEMGRHLGWNALEHAIFRDHEKPSDAQLASVISKAGSQPVVITEKDWVKAPEWFRRSSNAYYLRIKVRIENEPEFLQLLIESVQQHES